MLGLNRSENYIQMYLFSWDLSKILATHEPPYTPMESKLQIEDGGFCR